MAKNKNSILYKYTNLSLYELCKLYEDFCENKVTIKNSESVSEYIWKNNCVDIDYRNVYIETLDNSPVCCHLLITNNWEIIIYKENKND